MRLLQTLSYIFIISVTLINQSCSNGVNNTVKKNNTEVLSVSSTVAFEGGTLPDLSADKTHLGREHVVSNTPSFPEVPKNVTSKNNSVSSPASNNSVVKSEKETVKLNGTDSVIVKNGLVNSTNSSSNPELTKHVNKTVAIPTTVKTSTTTVELPKKPLKTVHDEIDPMDPNFVKSEIPPPKMASLDPTVTDKNTRRANYVVPIVAVILSVPLVAYIMSVLYKRGSDWWQHRNYRRMDYLIEGMYNS